MKALYWKLRIAIMSLRWATGVHLGDTAFYRGKRWVVCQGVMAPVWTLRSGDESADVHESEFRAPFLRNCIRRVRFGYGFYMGYWYGIWMNDGIRPAVRGLNIWG